eukprot:2342699-Rhodomonas_salina.1
MKKDARGNTTPILRHFAEAALLQPGEYAARLDDEHYVDRAMLIYASREANTRIAIHLPGESDPHEFDWDKETEQVGTLQLLWKNMAESGELDSWALSLNTNPSEENLTSQEGSRAVVEPEEEWTCKDVNGPTPAALIGCMVTQRPPSTEVCWGIRLTALDNYTHAEQKEHDLQYLTVRPPSHKPGNQQIPDS